MSDKELIGRAPLQSVPYRTNITTFFTYDCTHDDVPNMGSIHDLISCPRPFQLGFPVLARVSSNIVSILISTDSYLNNTDIFCYEVL